MDYNPTGFGILVADAGLPKELMLTPWEELRRQLALFRMHVIAEEAPSTLVRQAPTPEIDERCDQWIRMFVSAKDRSGMVPPPDLRPWLTARAEMGIAMVNYEISIQKELPTPDLKKHFAELIYLRLIQFWHDAGRDQWVSNDPNNN